MFNLREERIKDLEYFLNEARKEIERQRAEIEELKKELERVLQTRVR